MSDLDDLRLFLRIVEVGSLRGAGAEQGMDPSRVTRRLSALEGRLGIKLVQRSRVRSTPTEAGRLYYSGLRVVLGELEALESEVTDTANRPRGLLRVAAPTEFGARFVAPVLRQLQTEHAALEVDLTLGSTFVDLVAQNIDVAVRVGSLPDSSLMAAKLADVPRVLVASPDYVSRYGAPEKPADLSDHECILWEHERRRIEFASGERVEVSGKFAVNSVLAILELVAAGAGIHLAPRWAFQKGIDEGRFQVLLAGFPLQAFPMHALYPPASYVPAKTRAFVDSMREAVRKIPGLVVTSTQPPSASA